MIQCNSYLEAKLTAVQWLASDLDTITYVRICYRDGYWWVDKNTPYGIDPETERALDEEDY